MTNQTSKKKKHTHVIKIEIDPDELACRIIEVACGFEIDRTLITPKQAIKQFETKVGIEGVAVFKLQAMKCIEYFDEVLSGHGDLYKMPNKGSIH